MSESSGRMDDRQKILKTHTVPMIVYAAISRPRSIDEFCVQYLISSYHLSFITYHSSLYTSSQHQQSVGQPFN
uniref:Uncharacterized protein n=1 Tax=Onchocerca volvulus TaxID=6282 RepID=A0A8R1U2Z4_ONCVO